MTAQKGPLRRISVFLLMSLLLFSTNTLLLAQHQDANEQGKLFEMSIGELMEIEVSSTTKTPMTIDKAPGTIYVFKGDELCNEGIATLQDLLRLIPGVQLSPNQDGNTALRFRGVGIRYNSNMLLVVDGVPRKDLYYGNFLVDEMFPIEQIEKVEILLGPGSVLYGAGAFGGVINITTKKGVNDLTFGYHSDNTRTVSAEEPRTTIGHTPPSTSQQGLKSPTICPSFRDFTIRYRWMIQSASVMSHIAY